MQLNLSHEAIIEQMFGILPEIKHRIDDAKEAVESYKLYIYGKPQEEREGWLKAWQNVYTLKARHEAGKIISKMSDRELRKII